MQGEEKEKEEEASTKYYYLYGREDAENFSPFV